MTVGEVAGQIEQVVPLGLGVLEFASHEHEVVETNTRIHRGAEPESSRSVRMTRLERARSLKSSWSIARRDTARQRASYEQQQTERRACGPGSRGCC